VRIWHIGTLCVPLALLAGCPAGDDDDTSAPADDDDGSPVDDDDATPPDPLADLIGVFNLTNVVRADGTSYIDFSGGFGTFAMETEQPFSPAGYLQTFSYGADAPFWRFDLGGWPLPAEGEWTVITPATWLAWLPAEQTWWDGGARVGLGNYLAQRLDFEDVLAYQVDDPLVPGAAAWSAGGSLGWDNPGGAEVVGWSAPGAVTLPAAASLVEPAEGSQTEAPAALPLTVRWTPSDDGSFVTLGLLRDRYSPAWIARVPDTGEYAIPPEVLHDELGPGEATLVLGRTLDTALPHPQGDLLVRSREERRATVRLLPDVRLDPAFGRPGEPVTITVDWWTAAWSAGATAEFGDGVTVLSVTPDAALEHRARIALDVAPDADLGGREVVLTSGADTVTVPGAFTLLDLLPQDTCDDADAGDALGPGTWQSTTAGGANDLRTYECIPWSLGAADAVYRVELSAGETLGVFLEAPAPSDGALALLTDCGDGLSAVACADDGYDGDPEALAFTAEDDGTYYIAVDGYFFAGEGQAFGGPFSLTVQTQTTSLAPGWMLPGQTRSFTLSGPADWSAGIGPADVSFGADVQVEAVSPAGPPRDLAILATASPGASPGPRDVSVDDPALGLTSFESALYVTNWPAFDGCSESVGDSVAPGQGRGYAPATNTIDQVGCFDWGSTGPEVVLPVDLLSGQSISATAHSADDLQLYLLSDCADGSSCVAGIDATVADEDEVLEYTAAAAGRYWLVVDVYGGLIDPLGPLVFDLTVELD
jgi:hypothetical protein